MLPTSQELRVIEKQETLQRSKEVDKMRAQELLFSIKLELDRSVHSVSTTNSLLKKLS